jgi:hypothetical protein
MFTGMGDGHSIYVPNPNQLELCPQNEYQDVRQIWVLQPWRHKSYISSSDAAPK